MLPTRQEDEWKYHNHRKLIFDRVKKINPESILEAGCNWGGNLEWMAEFFPGAKLYGCDNQDYLIEKAIISYPGIEFKVCDIGKLPYPDKSIDVVICDMVLYYFGTEQLDAVIQELKRVAKKAVIISDTNQEKFKRFIDMSNDLETINWRADTPEIEPDIRFVFTLLI